MSHRRLSVFIAAVGLFAGACGSGTGGTSTGTGGASGGALGSGGTSSSGGTTGKGGATATGGTSASGGTTGTGGSATGGRGTGGSGTGGVASGGTSGGGGRSVTGTGGAAGRAGGSGGTEGATGGAGGAATGTAGTHGGGGGAKGNAVPSAGCGKTPTLKNSPSSAANQNTLTVSGTSRQFLIRWPSNYDNTNPYRLILDFHGAGGKDTDLAPSYFGLFDLSGNTTIFIAPSAANGGIWDATADLAFVDEILKTVEADLCIDTSRVELEGFSQGGAMIATLACARPGVFRAAVGHSRGGLTAPSTCQPIPYLGSLGLHDISGNSQATQTDPFAKWDGCTVDTMPLAQTGSHVCTSYKGCPAADPVIWCSFDGPHTASPTDSGKSTSWMPAEVWPFLSQF